jgi:hypothetical protein
MSLLLVPAAQALTHVKYVSNNLGLKEDYYLEIIETAMQRTQADFGEYKIDFSQRAMSAERKQDLLIAGDIVNIDRLNGVTTQGYREALLQIKHPLLRGFMGYRIPLIRRDSQSQFNQVNSLADLRKFPMGFGKGWEGYIYKAAGFNLIEPINFDLLLKMLAGHRFDFIPLSAVEIEETYALDNQPLTPIGPEATLLLHSEMPQYFYVSPNALELATRLDMGLQIMEADGSMNRIFDKYFAERLKNLHLSQRKVIEIPNPQIPGISRPANPADYQPY